MSESDAAERDALVVRFTEQARNHGAAIEKASSKRADQAYEAVTGAYRRLETLESADALVPLLEHPNPWVRMLAGSFLVEVEPERAEAVLKDVARLQGLVGFNAGLALREWKAGRLRM